MSTLGAISNQLTTLCDSVSMLNSKHEKRLQNVEERLQVINEREQSAPAAKRRRTDVIVPPELQVCTCILYALVYGICMQHIYNYIYIYTILVEIIRNSKFFFFYSEIANYLNYYGRNFKIANY